jgi:ribonuclease G
LPLNWFRRRKQQQEQEAAPQPVLQAPPATPDIPSKPAAEAAADGGSATKRRRGTRGGRNRKRKPAGAGATATADQPAAEKEKKPARERAPREKQDRTSRARTNRRRQQTKRAPLPAAKRELLVSVGVTERRVAVLEDDKVAEVYLERPDRRSIAGNIYLGTVDNVLPGMEAAFVDIGLEKNGFLYVDEIVTPELEGKRHHGKRIQDLISRGETILVQAVKDPMKSKGARLTTEISLAGRFVVFVPSGEGFGVSRRLEDDERTRLRDILKSLNVKKGGLIVRTAAEGASAEDIERDFDFLQRLWKTIEQQAKSVQTPALVYQEAELPLRVTRDLFTEDFERALVDDDRTYKRIVGYLKKTSPHMAERVVRHRSKTPLLEEFGVDQEIKSTLSRRVDLPSGGYLVFDYAEAFTVIDVNTGRFVGSRSKSSTQTLEDTITKNNIEAVKEVVRQLRLRDIGGIIVIDFIDMANPKNRANVEEALRQELERDRTKTYVVEISPLGLVEMTRQNVTDGPREILAKKCPVCAGDGIVVSEQTAAVDLEQKLRSLVKGSRNKVFRIEVNAHVASVLIGPGARRLAALEEASKRRFVIETREDVPHDHLEVLAQGAAAEPEPGPVAEGSDVSIKLVEIGLHDGHAGVGKLNGVAVVVADCGGMIGKKVQAHIERVMGGVAYATLVSPAPRIDDPITAEAEAERPTRARRTTKPKAAVAETAAPEADVEEVAEDIGDEVDAVAEEPVAGIEPTDAEEPPKPKKKTRRGTRGGRNRKRKPAAASVNGDAPEIADEPAAEPEHEASEPQPEQPKPQRSRRPKAPARIHLPPETLGEQPSVNGGEPAVDAVAAEEPGADAVADGDEAPKPKKKTRRGTRGGRNRKRKPAGAAQAAEGSAEPSTPE